MLAAASAGTLSPGKDESTSRTKSMDRRKSRRWPRQLDIRFWAREGEDKPHRAVASNVSLTGIFVRTSAVFKAGTRIRLEVLYGGRSFMTEVVVARAIKTPSHFQTVKPSGMGMRFMSSEELVRELLPGLPGEAASSSAPTSGPAPAQAATAAPGVPPSSAEAPVAAEAPAGTKPSTSETARERTTPGVPDDRMFDLRYATLDRFATAFERDVMTGGLFIPCPDPLPLDTVVHVRIAVDGVAVQPIVIASRVVHRMEPPPGDSGGPNLLVGMGVQFTDADRAIALLRAFLS